jgi:hypothetical protein
MSRARILADYVSSGDELADKLDLSGGAMTGAITTNSTFDGVDVGVRDGILTSTTTTAAAALPTTTAASTYAPKASPAFTGTPTGITAAHLTGAAALPAAVTGGSGLTAIAGVTTGSGNVTIANGDLVIGNNGKGVTFSATNTPAQSSGTATHNTLDDYEEGTWSPGVIGGTMTFTLYSAFYTKIGNVVTINLYWEGNNNGDSTGFYVDNLPFTSQSSNSFAVGNFNYAVANVNFGWATGRVSPNSTQIYFSKNPQVALVQTDIDNSHFIFSITYFSA